MTDQTIQMTFGGFPVVQMDPTKYPEAAGKANGYLCPLGCQPGIGYVLMFRRHLAQLQTVASAGNLNSAQPLVLAAGEKVTIPLYIVNALKVSGGPLGDPDSVYLVKLTDQRWHARMSDVALQINVRCPAPPATSGANLYYAESLDSGSIYTWSRACEVVWGACSLLGAFPGLPYAPDGTPEGFHFIGVSALDALAALLDRISCDLARNPLTGVYSIVQSGIVQPGLATILAQGRDYLDDADPFDARSALMPETIRVYFHRRDLHYGTEPATQQAAGNWLTESWTKIDVPTGDAAAVGGTVVAIWDDLPALVAFNGTLTNTSALTTRAAERAANYKADASVGSARRRTVFQGVVAGILPGSQVKAVHWHNLDSRPSAGNGGGLQTMVYNFPGLPQLVDNGARLFAAAGGAADVTREALISPDFARHGTPDFPDLDQLITIDGTAGALAFVNSDGLVAGHVTRSNPAGNFGSATDPYVAAEACWVAVVNLLTGGHVATASLISGERYLCRLNGTTDYGSDKRPLYLLNRADNHIWGITVSGSDIADGATGFVTLSDGRTVAAKNISGQTMHTGDSGAVFEDLVTSTFYLLKAGSGATLVRFELTADLVYATDPSADNAVVMTFGGGTYNPDGAAIRVFDFMNDGSYGTWSGKAPSGGTSGYQGWAILKPDSGRYEIVWMETQARWIEFTLYADLVDTDASKATCPVVAFWEGRDPDPAAAGVTIYNLPKTAGGTVYLFTGKTNDSGYAVWDEKLGHYRIVVMKQSGGNRRVKALVNQSPGFYPADATATVDNVATFDGTTAPVITTATNLLKLAGCDNEVVVLEERTANSDWIITEVQGKVRRRVQGLVNGGFFATDTTAAVDTITTYDGLTAPTVTTANNPLKLSGQDDDFLILEEDTAASPSTWFIAEVTPYSFSLFLGVANGNFSPVGDFDPTFTPQINASVSVVDLVPLTSDDSVAGPISASNSLSLAGNDGDQCYVLYERRTHTYELLAASRQPALLLEGYVYADFTQSDATFTMSIYRAFAGRWPDAAGIPGAAALTVTVKNFEIALDTSGDLTFPECRTNPAWSYLFDGHAGAACRAIWDDHAKAFRVQWVEPCGTLRRRVQALVNDSAGFKTGDSSVTVDTVTTFGGSSAPTITTAANPLKLWGYDNFVVILEENTTASPSTWFVASVRPLRVCRKFKCLLNGDLLKTDANATIDTVTATDSGPAPTPTSAANFLQLDGIDNTPGIICEDWSSGTVAYRLESLSDHKARFIGGTLGGTLTAGGSVSCTVTSAQDGESPGSTETVYSAESLFTGTSGKKFKAYYNPDDDQYYFLWIEC